MCDLDLFTFIKACFMAQNVICLGTMLTKSLVGCIFHVFLALLEFCLAALSIANGGYSHLSLGFSYACLLLQVFWKGCYAILISYRLNH